MFLVENDKNAGTIRTTIRCCSCGHMGPTVNGDDCSGCRETAKRCGWGEIRTPKLTPKGRPKRNGSMTVNPLCPPCLKLHKAGEKLTLAYS